MKEYMKPEVEVIKFASESVTNDGIAPIDADLGDISGSGMGGLG